MIDHIRLQEEVHGLLRLMIYMQIRMYVVTIGAEILPQ